MERELSERIRERAYEMWLANGCREGGAEQDWLFAEREVLSARTLGNSPVVAEIVADSLTTKYRKSGLDAAGLRAPQLQQRLCTALLDLLGKRPHRRLPSVTAAWGLGIVQGDCHLRAAGGSGPHRALRKT
jgi:DUF2934 family protein